MADGGQHRERRFSAFVSYSTDDVAFARRLHKRLETYRLPRKLRSLAPGAPPPERLKPLFRDVDELIAAYDLSTAVQDALAQSDFLIVVCSPNAVESEWVGREIDYFRKLHGDSHILAVLIDGTPETAFHPALLGAQGGPRLEPLAADFRPESPSRRLAMLKLVAALAGVELDDLIHRDAQRRLRRTIAVAASAMAAVLVVGVLITLTLTARAETERKRDQATGMVDHMLTDVRKTLQRTGRLDQLAAVNETAMAYYRGQDLAKLTDDELRQRAKLLRAMGEDDLKRGELEKARAAFEEAQRTTAALLAKDPNDTQRIFDHAQSEFWVGEMARQAGDSAEALSRCLAYAALADRLVALDPREPKWRLERAYAAGNLGTLSLRHLGHAAEAERYFLRALDDKRFFAMANPSDHDARQAIAESLAWLSDSQKSQGKYQAAMTSRRMQHRILLAEQSTTPSDISIATDLIANRLAVARIHSTLQQWKQAEALLNQGRREAERLATLDPDNRNLARQVRVYGLFQAQLALQQQTQATAHVGASRFLSKCTEDGTTAADQELQMFCLALSARFLRDSGDREGAARNQRKVERYIATSTDKFTAIWGIDLAEVVSTNSPLLN